MTNSILETEFTLRCIGMAFHNAAKLQSETADKMKGAQDSVTRFRENSLMLSDIALGFSEEADRIAKMWEEKKNG